MLPRRAFLLGGLALAGCSSSAPQARQTGRVSPRRISYGRDASQFGELTVPVHPFHEGVIVIVHGGFWRSQYGLSLGRPLAADLAYHGYTCWNLEYRRLGNGGGWPATFDDVAAGLDRLASLDVDTSAVVAVGHSAGGHLAVWAAGRAGAGVRLAGVVSQAGVLDFATASALGGGAVAELLGGSPSAVPERYAFADPIRHVPLPVPVLCVHARADANVPYTQSEAYVAAATRAGGHAALHTVPGDHFTLIDPTTPAWSVARAALPDLLAGRLPAA